MTSSGQNEWTKLMGKQAFGIDDFHFGEVMGIESEYIITQRDVAKTEWFYIPKQEVQGYDNKRVFFRVTEEEARILYLSTKIVIKEPVKKGEKFIAAQRNNNKKTSH